MARGSSYGGKPPVSSPDATTRIPRRATRSFQAAPVQENDAELPTTRASKTGRALSPPRTPVVPATVEVHPLARHRSWLGWWVLAFVGVIVGALVLASAGIFLRPPTSQVIPYDGRSYPAIAVQLGGNLQTYDTWEHPNGPIPLQTTIPTHPGPYSVLGKPTITADFINRVLASYHSPTAGMGQSLYDLGVKYGIDPVYALAFFMHESLFGTTGEARVTFSLGNERCIPDRSCIDQDRGGYARMNSWQDGFEQWYKLIRNLYVAQWGRVTIDQIIPKYAPNSDGNDEAEYIASLKHEIDTWHAGILRP